MLGKLCQLFSGRANVKLTPEKQKPSANANRSSVYTSDELSQGKLEKTYKRRDDKEPLKRQSFILKNIMNGLLWVKF